MRCYFCGNKIVGKYYKYRQRRIVVCKDCYESLPKCRLCGLPFKRGLFDFSGEFCQECKSQGVKCRFCRQIIVGEYLIYEKETLKIAVCKACNDKLPKCLLCGIPIEEKKLMMRHLLCSDCEKKALWCSKCSNLITNKFWRSPFDSRILCEECFKKSEKCSVCQYPLDGFKIVRGNKVCNKCLNFAPKCSCCKEPILKIIWRFGRNQGVFCEHCYKTHKPCECCGAPTGKDPWRLDDGRLLCSSCKKTAVMDPQEASKILDDIEEFLKTSLGMEVKHSSGLTLVDRYQLREIAQDQPEKEDLLGLFKRINHKFDIYLLYGLPKALAISVLAHEFAHAWQAENIPVAQDLILKEGFAEWVAYKVLQAFKYRQEAECIMKRKDLYGQGFHFFRKVEKNKGSKFTIEYIKSIRTTSLFSLNV